MKGIVIFKDSQGRQIERRKITQLDIKQDVLNNKSNELYNEPNPCVIYSTYCRNHFGIELLNKLEQLNKNEIEFTINNLPIYLSDILIIDEKINSIQFL